MRKTPIKTVYLQDLEGLKHLLHADRLSTMGGKKCSLNGILCELDGMHKKFKKMLDVIQKNEYHCEALDFDRDVNYSEWASEMHLHFDYPLCTVTNDAEMCLDIKGVDHAMTDGLNASSERELVSSIQRELMAFKKLLAEIDEALKNFRPDGEALFLEEEARFMEEHGDKVRKYFHDWKSDLGNDPELIRKHLQGKVTTEFVHLAGSGALEPKYRTQLEADTEQYRPELNLLLTSLIPSDMNALFYYSALREIMDFTHGELLPRMRQLGLYIFNDRKKLSLEARNSLFFFLAILKLIYEEKVAEREADGAGPSAFARIVQHENPKMLMARLHQLIDGRKGADVGCVLLKCCQEGYLIRRPTQREYESEFILHGGWSAIHNYMSDNNINALDRANQIVIF